MRHYSQYSFRQFVGRLAARRAARLQRGQATRALTLTLLFGAAVFSFIPTSAIGASKYWDLNGTANGLGSGTGTWDLSAANWNTATAGTTTTVAFANGDDAFFQTTGTNTVTLGANLTAASITQTTNGTLTTINSGAGTQITLSSGNITNSGNSAFVINPNIVLGASGIFNAVNAITLGGVVSDAGSNFGFTKTSAGTLTLSGASTYTGATNVTGGTVIVGGAVGASINGSSAVSVTGGNGVTLDYTTTGDAATDKINNAATVTITSVSNPNLSGSAGLTLLGNSGADTNETIGTLTLGGGAAIVGVTQGNAGRVTALTVTNGLTRSNFGTAVIRGSSLGSQATQVGEVILGTAGLSGLVQVGASTSTTGAAGNAKDLKIVPYLVGDSNSGGLGSASSGSFLTYDTGGLGFRVLSTNEQNALAASTDTFTNTNVSYSPTAANSVLTLDAVDRTWNSLQIGHSSTNVSRSLLGGGGTLAITSGALQTGDQTAADANVLGGFSKITFGNNVTGANAANEAIVFVNGSSGGAAAPLTISSPVDVTQGGGLTKAGVGTLVLSAANRYTGQTTINHGTLQVGGGGTTGDLGATSAVALFGGNLTFNRTLAYAFSSPVTVSAPGTINNTGSGSVSLGGAVTANAATTLSNTGAGQLSFGGAVTANAATTISATSTGPLSFDGPVTANATTTVSSTGAGPITFTGKLASSGTVQAFNITGTAGSGGVTFAPAPGNAFSLSNSTTTQQVINIASGGALTLAGDSGNVNTISYAGTSSTGGSAIGVVAGGTLNVTSGVWNATEISSNSSASIFRGSLNVSGGTFSSAGNRYLGGNINVSGNGTFRAAGTGSTANSAGQFQFGGDSGSGIVGTPTFGMQGGFFDLAKQLGSSFNDPISGGTALYNQTGGTAQMGVTAGSSSSAVTIGGTTAGAKAAMTLAGGRLTAVSLAAGGAAGASGINDFNLLGGSLTVGTYTATNLGYSSTVSASGTTVSNPVADSTAIGTLTNRGGTLAPGGNLIASNTVAGTSVLTLTPTSGLTTIAGNYVVNSGALAVNLGGATPSTAFQDAANAGKFSTLTISGTGTNTLGGNLLVNLIDSATAGTTFAPSVAQSFKIISYTGAAATNSGTFSGNNVGATNLSGTNGVIANDGLTAFGITYNNTAVNGGVTLGGTTLNQYSGSDGDGNYSTLGNWAAMVPNTSAFIARFADAPSASGAIAVNVGANTTVQGLQFASTARNYTLSSANSSGLVLDASAQNTTNSMSGAVTLASAQITDSSAGAGNHAINVPVTLNSSLLATVSTAAEILTVGGAIGETGGAKTLTKLGAGTLALSGTNTYSGGTTIGAGKLLVTNNTGSATGTGGVIIGTAGTLASGAGTTGAIAGLVTTAGTGSIIAPGATAASNTGTIGALTLQGGLNLAAGATIPFDLAAVSGSDLINVTSGTFTGGTAASSIIFNFNDAGLTPGASYALVNWTNATATGVDLTDFAATGVAGSFSFAAGGNELDFVPTAVPEPSTWLAGILALGSLGYSQRRRASGWFASGLHAMRRSLS